MAKSGKTSYSPALRLQMKMEAEKPRGKGKVQPMAGSVKELMGDNR